MKTKVSETWSNTAIGIMLAVFISILYLHSMEINGRLSIDLGYDDVVYARDAASRLLTLENKGFVPFFRDLFSNPPHSVFSTFLGISAFMVGGLNEFSLYASNIIILLVLVLFIGDFLTRVSRALALMCFAFVLLSPLSVIAISQFRPDIALGVSSAIMVILYLRGLVSENKKTIMLSGGAFGASLLIKPTFFAHTIAIAILLSLIMVCNNFLARKDWNPLPKGRLTYLYIFWGIGVILSLPYAILNGQEIAAYFWNNALGQNSHIWAFSRSLSMQEVAGAYYNYILALNGYYFYFTILVLSISLFILYQKRQFDDLKILSAQLAIAFSSLAIIVWGHHKNEFFLLTFLWLLLLTTVLAMALVCENINLKSKKIFATLIIIGIIFAKTINYTSNPREAIRGVQTSEVLRGANSWNEIIFNSIRKDFQSAVAGKNHAPPRVFFTFAGPVNGDTLAWIGYRDKYPINSNGVFISNDINKVHAESNAYDYLVIPNPNLAKYEKGIPSGQVQSDILSRTMADSNFEPIYTASSEKNYFIFRNKRVTEQYIGVIDSDGIFSIDGFREDEGPYPQWTLPRLRWMNSKEARICLADKISNALVVDIRARSPYEGQLLILNENGDSLGRINFQPNIFQEEKFLIPVNKKTHCYKFKFNKGDGIDKENLILFTKIRFLSKAKSN